jgi:hypothetical protein
MTNALNREDLMGLALGKQKLRRDMNIDWEFYGPLPSKRRGWAADAGEQDVDYLRLKLQPTCVL